MSRQRTEINPIRADRVKILMKREKITQTILAERIHQTQQNVSRIMQKRQPLTEETARLIVNAFPEYRIEWILGYEDFMTEKDKPKETNEGFSDRTAAMVAAYLSELLTKIDEIKSLVSEIEKLQR